MTRAGLAFILLCFICGSLEAQPFAREPYSIPCFSNGNPIEHPFTGGFFNPMHQFVDIDGDGDFDLFIYDFNDGSLSYFRNDGSPQVAQFRLTEPSFSIPPIQGWFRMVDIDGDAKIDLMTSSTTPNTLAIYKNTGTPQSPQFTLFVSSLRDSANAVVYSETYSIPAFADMDGDGDLDFFSLNSSVGTINYYQNIGSPTAMLLAFRTNRYQNIQICPGCGGPERPNPGQPFRPFFSSMHGNGSMYFADIDADNDNDMFYGDLFDGGLFFYQNNGTTTHAVLDSITGRFPPGNPVITSGFNQPTLVDIDGDNDVDLFVSVLPPLQRIDNFRFYRNVGTPSVYNFNLEAKNYLSTIDVGLVSEPTFADIDGDGDADMFIGDLDGHVALLRNIGTPGAPSFSFDDSAFIEGANVYAFAPRFVDIDNDNDLDMFIGHFAGKIEFYRNMGTPTAPQFAREQSFFDSISVGNYAVPAFFDIDNDGDVDMFVGGSTGKISFYRNTGTPQTFAYVLETTMFGGISAGPNSNLRPTFADVDHDADSDLIIGVFDGRMLFYRNDGPPGNPAFTFVTGEFGSIDTVADACPAFFDIDNDGDQDMFVGGSRGGLDFYRNGLLTSVEDESPGVLPVANSLLQNYPNPFNPSTTIEFSIAQPGRVTLKVYDVLGREAASLVDGSMTQGMHRVQFNAAHLPSGVYFYRLRAGNFTGSRKLVVLK